jgi:hypothetical protein
LWITCRTSYQDWSHPLDAPKTWTPLFFLDDAAALAAGHRPCGLCRRSDYEAYRTAVTEGLGEVVHSDDLNKRLAEERLSRGRGLDRAGDRILWDAEVGSLPMGAVVIDPTTNAPSLVTERHLQDFSFDGWVDRRPRPDTLKVEVLTPPTSVIAIKNGFIPRLHPTAAITTT